MRNILGSDGSSVTVLQQVAIRGSSLSRCHILEVAREKQQLDEDLDAKPLTTSFAELSGLPKRVRPVSCLT